jgi:signal transduction histidine kinase
MRAPNKAKGQGPEISCAWYLSDFQDQRPSPSKVVPCDSQINDQVARNQQAVLLRMLDPLSTETELPHFLNHVVAVVADQFAAPSAYLCLHCKEQNTLFLEACYVRRDPSPVQGSDNIVACAPRTARTGFLWQQVLWIPRPFLIPDLERDERVPFRDILLVGGVKQLLVVPLVSGNEVLGFFATMVPDANPCEPERFELAQALAQPIVLALKLARLAENARQSAVLEERKRMARGIHDTFAQSLTAILIQMDLAEEVFLRNQQEALRHITLARRLAREGLVDVRRSIFALRAQVLEKHNLTTALRQLGTQLTSDTGIRHEFSLQGSAHVIPHAVEAELLCIAQEALTNVHKHAQATKVRIELISDPHCVGLSIQDDGRGFDLSTAHASHGFGLLGIQERARNIGGQLVVQSQSGCGTLVQITVPLEIEQTFAQKSA